MFGGDLIWLAGGFDRFDGDATPSSLSLSLEHLRNACPELCAYRTSRLKLARSRNHPDLRLLGVAFILVVLLVNCVYIGVENARRSDENGENGEQA